MLQIKMLLSATSERLLMQMQPGKWPEGEISSLGTTMLANSWNYAVWKPLIGICGLQALSIGIMFFFFKGWFKALNDIFQFSVT